MRSYGKMFQSKTAFLTVHEICWLRKFWKYSPTWLCHSYNFTQKTSLPQNLIEFYAYFSSKI